MGFCCSAFWLNKRKKIKVRKIALSETKDAVLGMVEAKLVWTGVKKCARNVSRDISDSSGL
jgi:hypothetical protein